MTPTHIQLRLATRADLPAILALEHATEDAPHWPAAAYAAILEPATCDATPNTHPLRCLFIAQSTTQPSAQPAAHAATPHHAIVGFAAGLLSPSSSSAETIAELESVAVALFARRIGIGRALCTAVLEWCRSQGATAAVLEVRSRSAAAIALYTQLGLTLAGRRPHYYRDPDDDALILRLPL